MFHMIDPCAQNPCKSGSCNKTSPVDYECICEPGKGFYGRHCEKREYILLIISQEEILIYNNRKKE